MICLRECQTRISSSICWPKLRVARISDYSLSVSVLHPDNWADVFGFLKPPGSMHDAFSIPRKTLGLRPNDQISKQKVYEQRISLKERPTECSYGNPKRRISEIMSDHSLSS